MALAKPVRALAVISLTLLLFLLYEINKKPPEVSGPGDLEQELPNEPMNERSLSQLDLCHNSTDRKYRPGMPQFRRKSIAEWTT